MYRILAPLGLCCAISLFAPSAASAVTIQTVPVGSPGNATDPATGSLYGAVPYNYRIGTYDVTYSQYAEFLNAKASAADPYNLLPSSTSIVGITRSPSAPYSYTVPAGYANKPIVGVTWYDAVRFVNWLQNGQGNGDTESGTYTITAWNPPLFTTVAGPSEAQRTAWAASNSFHWLLPSENEWYKAAYYNAGNGTYYTYPFQSDALPTSAIPPGGPNTGNFFNGIPNSNELTDVGSYTSSASPFGSYDMGGDVWQWNDTVIASGARGLRGAGWFGFGGPEFSAASVRLDDWFPFEANNQIGFRVASVPEPSTGLLAVLACGLLRWRRKLLGGSPKHCRR